MSKNRKNVSASIRWQVFARDGFMCRYCGARAGQDGVELHADHVMSIADGGDNSIQNLIAACQKCNGGKGAKSLQSLPDAADVAERMKQRAESVKQQADAMREAMTRDRELEQRAVDLKCEAFGVNSVRMSKGEETHIIKLCQEFGAETVLGWYRVAAYKTTEAKAVRYVCGIARNVREGN